MRNNSSLLRQISLIVLSVFFVALLPVAAQVPVISNFAPLTGPVGTLVTIKGGNFNDTAANNHVHFGKIKATVITAAADSLVVAVPTGSSHQRISVTVNKLTAYSSLPFATTAAVTPFVPGYFSLGQAMLPDYNFPHHFTMADFSNDGKPEIMATGSAGQAIYAFNNSTPGNPFFVYYDFMFSNVTTQYGRPAPVMADITLDGKMDLATLNSSSQPLMIFINGSTNPGNFGIATYTGIATLASPIALSTGDVDGDGKADIAVGYSSNNNVSFFRNNTQISLANPVFDTRLDFLVGFATSKMQLADMDADGRADLLAFNSATGVISIFRSTGTPGTVSFAAKVDIASTTFSNLVTADLDADGYPELLVFNAGSTNIAVLKNNSSPGSIAIGSANTVVAADKPQLLAVDDLDGDGKPDIAIAYGAFNAVNNGVSILKNTSTAGNFSFAAGVNYPTAALPSLLDLVDVDKDGNLDIVTAVNQQPILLRNNRNSPPIITSFSPLQGSVGDTVTITGRNFSGATAVGFGGTPFVVFTVVSDRVIKAVPGIGAGGDIAVTTPYGTATRAGFGYTMPPAITSVTPSSGPVGSTVTIKGSNFSSTAANNLVQLGTIRATVLTATTDSITVSVPSGAPNQRFTVTTRGRTAYSPRVFHTTFGGAGPVFNNTYFDTTQNLVLFNGNTIGVYGLSQGDMNGDGKSDLMLLLNNGIFGRHEPNTLRNTTIGNNLLFGPPSLITGGRPMRNLRDYPVADLNGDGKADLIISRSDSTYVQADLENTGGIYKNISSPGAIGFTNVFNIQNSAIYDNEFYTADFDGDGRPDVVAKSNFSNLIAVFRNTTVNDLFSFAPPIVIGPIGQTAQGGIILLDDFNNDGRTDLAIQLKNKVLIYRNTAPVGSIAFAPVVTVNFQINNTSLSSDICIAGDFDGDGKTDFAATNNASSNISFLRNNSTNGNLAFDAPVNIAVGLSPFVMATADLDGDGKPDIVMLNGTRGTILKNNSIPGSLAFAAPVTYPIIPNQFLHIADWDNDGKPDIIAAGNSNTTIPLLRNTIGEPLRLVLCPPAGNGSITSSVTGTSYQWQVNTGSGFADIANNANYSNVNGPVLQLNNIPSDWYGYQYRCVTNTGNSYVFVLRFVNTWVGTTNTAWDNPANWSCGTVPDANTDVFINSGTVVINANTVVRSLKTNPSVNITVAAGFTLTVLQ
jgi:large repetitive protein